MLWAPGTMHARQCNATLQRNVKLETGTGTAVQQQSPAQKQFKGSNPRQENSAHHTAKGLSRLAFARQKASSASGAHSLRRQHMQTRHRCLWQWQLWHTIALFETYVALHAVT